VNSYLLRALSKPNSVSIDKLKGMPVELICKAHIPKVLFCLYTTAMITSAPRLAILTVAALSSSLMSSTAFSNTFSQLSLSASEEGNITRSLDSAGELNSQIFRVEYTHGKLVQLNVDNSLTLSGLVSASKYDDFEGFDQLRWGGSLSYIHKSGFGPYAPKLGFDLSFSHSELEGDARDNNLVTASFSYQKRISAAWLFNGGVEHQISRADSLPADPNTLALIYDDPSQRQPGEIYDFEATTLFTTLEYAFENGVLLSADYRYTDGVIISTTKHPTLHLYKISEAVYSDSAFSEGWYAYQIEANTSAWSLGASLPTGTDSSINISYSLYNIDGSEHSNYENDIVAVSFVHNF